MRVFTFLLFLLPIVGNAQVWTEDFDGANTTNPPIFSTPGTPCSDSRDYFDIVCVDNSGVNCPNEASADYQYTNADGQFFGARDTDTAPCAVSSATLRFEDIDVSSCVCEVLYICFDVAETRNMGDAAGAEWGNSNMREDTWDSDANVFINAAVDGASMTRVTAIEAFDNSDTRPGIDVNCNGSADDPGEPELTDTFTQYCFELPSSGNTVDLEFEVNNLTASGEDIAIDNIEIHCGAPAGTILNSCTPFISSDAIFVETFDGSNTSNPFSFPPACDDTPSRDYFGIVCIDGNGCPNEINDDYIYTGATGQFFGVRDMDAASCTLDETISATGIDISSCAGAYCLYLCFDAAESQPMFGREMDSQGNEDTWDGNSSVQFSTSIDGGAFETVTAIESSNGTETRPGIDTNCGGGSAGTAHLLSDEFQNFCFRLTSLGNSLDLNIRVIGLNTDGEDVAIDNISVFCVDDLACLPSMPIEQCQDVEPFILTCPADNLNLPAGCNPTIPNPDPSLVVVEGCVLANVIHVGDVASDDGCTRTVIRTYRAVGDNGETADCEQTFTYSIDDAPPVLSEMPADVVVDCDAVPLVPTITATDACTTTGNPMVFFDEEDNTSPCEGGTITRTWTVEADACGNMTTPHVQVITVNPSPPPTITCPADVVVDCIDNFTLDPNAATATSVCNNIIAVYIKNPIITGVPGCDGTVYTYIYVAVDDCGRTAECEQQVLIQNTPASITVPAGSTVACVKEVDLSLDDATVTGGCANYNLYLIPPVASDLDGCPGSTYTYTYRLIDDCGNIVEEPVVFTNGPTDAPTIDAPANLTVNCLAGASPNPDNATVTTSCGVGSTVTVSGPQIFGPTDCSGTIYRYTYTVTDACGRTATDIQDMTVQNGPPVFNNCPEDNWLVLNCEDYGGEGGTIDVIEAWIASVTASTSCNVPLTVFNNFNPNNINTCMNNGFNTVTFRATDNCGRTTFCQGTYVVVDTEAPEIIEEAQDHWEICNYNTQDNLNAWVQNQGGALASDGCSGGNISWQASPANPQINCNGGQGTTSVTVQFIVTDNCGNKTTTTATFNALAAPGFAESGEDESLNEGSIDLFQNQPNPFLHETVIGFDLPKAMDATIVIYDISGRELKRISGEYAKGYNSLSINSKELNAKGFLIYQLSTALGSKTKRMILVE